MSRIRHFGLLGAALMLTTLCAQLELGAELDWRMPNRAELSSIHDFTTAAAARRSHWTSAA